MTRATPDPRLPNLFVIGAPKCGTTSLHSALASTPGIYMTKVKEPGFFSTEHHFRRGLDYYLDTFFGGAQGYSVRGESTPWYFYSAEARERIQESRHGYPTKFVVLVRQPADRAYSMYLDQQRAGLESRSFERAVADELDESRPDRLVGPPHRQYLWASCYTEHIQAWRNAFGTESVAVFLTDDLRDPERFWTDLSSFLAVDLGGEPLTNLPKRQKNAATGRRWRWVDRAIQSTNGRNNVVTDGLRRYVPARWYRQLAQTASSLNQVQAPPPEHPPTELLNTLDEHFRSEVLRLERVLDRPLAGWLPEHIQRAR